MPESIAAIQRWEDSGRQLEKTVQAYLDSCKALDFPIPGYSSGARTLISRIEDRLHSFNHLLTDRLNSARSSLAHTRNKLAAPIFRLPDEIMSRIFSLTIDINIGNTGGVRDRSAGFVTKVRYHTLHKLLGVCSEWRRIGVSQGTLWTLVPVIRHRDDRLTSMAAQLSFERAGSCRLHLVADYPGPFSQSAVMAFMEDALSRYGSRFYSVNFRSEFYGHLVKALDRLIQATSESPGSLRELSVCLSRSRLDHRRGCPFLYGQELHQYNSFNRMLESLHVLRLCRVRIHFRDLSLRSLTKLRFQKISYVSHDELEVFLRALSSSSQLRDLEIISVFVSGSAPSQPSDFQISLPALQRLYLEDLYRDTFNAILASIAPGSYGVTLHLNRNCYMAVGHGPDSSSILLALQGLKFRDFQIDTLIMGSDFDGSSMIKCHDLLKLVPTVTSLYIDSWTFGPQYLLNLVSPEDPNSGFPKLIKLHISRGKIPLSDLDALKDVVASYPIEELGIGVLVTEMGEGDHSYDLQQPHEKLDPIRSWLLDTVPRVVWLPSDKFSKTSMHELESNVWAL
ncbi:hypothetical protein RSAG8_12049, partial [Rhizoctonia solani AG-8 WAC10335]